MFKTNISFKHSSVPEIVVFDPKEQLDGIVHTVKRKTQTALLTAEAFDSVNNSKARQSNMKIPSVEASPNFEHEEILDIVFNSHEVVSRKSGERSIREMSSMEDNDR